MSALRGDMQYWLKREFGAELSDIVMTLRTDQLEAAIERRYEGGLSRFIDIHTERVRVLDSQLDPQIALRRRLIEMLGRPFAIAACHQIIRVDRSNGQVRLVMRVIDEDERGTRLIQHGAIIRLVVFSAMTGRMLPDEGLEIVDLDWHGDTYVNSYLQVMDPDRYSDKFWQYHECYRPGSDDGRAPMDGCYGPTRKDSRHDDYRAFRSTMDTTIPVKKMETIPW